MTLLRRGFLGGLVSLLAAPAIIRTPGVLMAVRPPMRRWLWLMGETGTRVMAEPAACVLTFSNFLGFGSLRATWITEGRTHQTSRALLAQGPFAGHGGIPDRVAAA